MTNEKWYIKNSVKAKKCISFAHLLVKSATFLLFLSVSCSASSSWYSDLLSLWQSSFVLGLTTNFMLVIMWKRKGHDIGYTCTVPPLGAMIDYLQIVQAASLHNLRKKYHFLFNKHKFKFTAFLLCGQYDVWRSVPVQ